MNIVIAGASGRMGRMLVEAVLAADDMKLTGALEALGSPSLGQQAAPGVSISADIVGTLKGADALIDFTRPEGTLAHLQACLASGTGLVVGTTGFNASQKEHISEAARRIPVVLAPNMAIGVNAVFKLAEVAAGILGEDYDVEILEAHHRHKVDAPSGTALRIGEVIAAKLGRALDEAAVHGREGVTGERDRKSIGFHAIRGGDIVGEHTVIFAGEGERVEITVRSGSRATYAQGALRACRFLAGRGPGLFDMQDVLGLR